MINRKGNLMRDLGIIALSIILAIFIAKTGILNTLLTSTREIMYIGSFLAGMFFTSVFTTAPATVTLVEIFKSNSLFPAALLGGLGALIGDLIIFRFVKTSLSEDTAYLIQKSKSERFFSIFHLKIFRWLIPFIGALVVASPLPDELGIAMMGLSKMKTSLFIPLSFLLNSSGILIIGLITKAV